MPFVTVKSFFSCLDVKWTLVTLKKLFSTKKIDFPKIWYKNGKKKNEFGAGA